MKNLYTNPKSAIKVLMALGLMLAGSRLMAQNAVNFNQYADNLTPVNAAYSALDKEGSVNLLGRKQYVGVSGSPSTFLFSGNVALPNMQASAGLFALNDQYGITHQTEINAYFAKSIRMSENSYLATAINAGLQSFNANFSSLDATDPQFSTDIRQTSPNAGLGLIYYTETYYFGFSAPQLLHLQTTAADYFKSSYYFSGAFIAALSDDIKLKPATLVAFQSGVPATFNLSGTLLLKNRFGIGANYSTNGQFAGMISVYANSFRLAYSYEVSTGTSGLAGFNNSTNEFSLSYRFGNAPVRLL